jgi:PIN domain nuclease of toxin-antitoxin system
VGHHCRDPFDRLLIAHALDEGYTIATHDPAFAQYGVDVIEA